MPIKSLKNVRKDFLILVVLAVFLLFTRVNVDPNIGGVFFGFVLLSMVLLITDDNISYKYGSGGSAILSAGVAMGAWFSLLLLASAVLKSIASPQSLVSHLAAQVPALSQDPALQFIIFTFIIPIAETYLFFGRLMEIVSDQFGISKAPDFSDFKQWTLVLGMAGLFTLFHINVILTKSVANTTPAFFTTFVFGVISGWLVVAFRGRIREAIYLHVLWNGVIMASAMSILPAAIMALL